MAIQWGGWHGHLRVGIEVANTGYDTWTPGIEVHVRTFVQCDSSWNFADQQLVTLRGNATADYNFYNGLQANQVIQVGTAILGNQVQNYAGGPDYYFEARLSGAYNGAAPAVGVGYRLPARPPRVPAAQSAPVWQEVRSDWVYLNWGETPDAGGSGLIEDNLQVSRNSAFTDLAHNSYAGGSERAVGGLQPGRQYWARARVRNGVGWSAWSPVSSGFTKAVVPAPPSSGPAWSDIRADSAFLKWGRTPDEGGSGLIEDQLQVSRNDQFTSLVFNKTIAGSQATVPGLAPGTRYWSRSRVRNGVGWSGWSAVTSATTNAFALSAPTVSNVDPDGLTLSWGVPNTTPTPTRYEIQIARNSSFTDSLQTISSTTWARTRRIEGISPATRYWMRVRAGTPQGWGAWSPSDDSETLSGAKVRRNGSWVDASVFVRINGQWLPCKVYKRVNGRWVL